MLGATVPQILYQWWFWLLIVLGLSALLYFVGSRGKSPPPFPRTWAFLSGHRQSVMRTMDLVMVIGLVLLGGLLLYLPAKWLLEALSSPEPVRAARLGFARMAGLVVMIVWSGMASVSVGSLSYFQSSLARRKRVILLALCLLPMVFTALAMAAEAVEGRWSLIQLCVVASALGWIVNAPAVLTGRHFTDCVPGILRRLRLVPSDSSS